MAATAPSAEREALLRDGYVVIPNVFPLELLDEVRTTIEDSDKGIRTLSSQHRHSDRYQGDHMFVGWSEADRAREGDIQDECFARLIACPGMIQALHRCGAAAPAFQTCSVMSKPPSAPPLYWHQDWGFWGHEITAAPPHKLFAFIYLCETSRENGCLRVLPGSHRARCPLHDELPAEDPNLHGGRDWKTEEPWEEDGSASPFFSDPEGAVDVPIRPGELVIGDSRLLHATWPNKTDGRRTSLTIWWIDSVDTLPADIRAYYRRGAAAGERAWSGEFSAAARESMGALMAPLLAEEGLPPAPSYDRRPDWRHGERQVWHGTGKL